MRYAAAGTSVIKQVFILLTIVHEETAKILGPLSATDQPVFFSVPAGEDDRAKRLPAHGEQLAKTADYLVLRGGPGVRIGGAHHPSYGYVGGASISKREALTVAVVTKDNDLVGDMAWNCRHCVCDGISERF